MQGPASVDTLATGIITPQGTAGESLGAVPRLERVNACMMIVQGLEKESAMEPLATWEVPAWSLDFPSICEAGQ